MFARNIVDSYTLNGDELTLFIDYIEKQPTESENNLQCWLRDTIAIHPSARELTAIIRAVRYLKDYDADLPF